MFQVISSITAVRLKEGLYYFVMLTGCVKDSRIVRVPNRKSETTCHYPGNHLRRMHARACVILPQWVTED